MLSVQLQVIGGLNVLTLRGELCATSIPALESYLDQLGSLPFRGVLLDVSEVTRLDPVGARVVIGMRHYVEARGSSLMVRGAGEAIRITLADADNLARHGVA